MTFSANTHRRILWTVRVQPAMGLGAAISTAFFGGLLLCVTMAFGAGTHLLVIGGSPIPAFELAVLSGIVAYRLRPSGGAPAYSEAAR